MKYYLVATLLLALVASACANTCDSYNGVYDITQNANLYDNTHHNLANYNHHVTGTFTGHATFTAGTQVNQYLWNCFGNGTVSTSSAHSDDGNTTWVDFNTLPSVHLVADANLGAGAAGQSILTMTAYIGGQAIECQDPDAGCYLISEYYAGGQLLGTYSRGNWGALVWGEQQAFPYTVPFQQASQGSPIGVCWDGSDLRDQLTDVDHGMSWDFFGTDAQDGTHTKVAWIKPGAKCGWLAIRDPFGKINNAHQLVGDRMWQPIANKINAAAAWQDSDTAFWKECTEQGNGFCALWWYDQPKLSGHHNDVIDSEDGVWNVVGLDGLHNLGVWESTGRCNYFDLEFPECQVWHPLPELGIDAIDLKFRRVPETDPKYRDKYGNTFPIVGRIHRNGNWEGVYDAFLQFKQAH